MREPTKSTVAAILTPTGRGAIATIAIDGPDAAGIVEKLFVPATSRPFIARPHGDIVYGRWSSSNEDLIVCRRDTDRVEVHCHGGVAASRAIIDSLVAAGCASLSWQEFVAREESNRIRVAARVALAECRTPRTAEILLDQYQGALAQAICEIDSLLERRHTDVARQSLELLISRSRLGLHLAAPWQVVIAGPPNVGKSSLINAVLGYERAIVFDQPGTTRDVVTALTAFDGWPVEICDTAGLGDSRDPLELAGISKAHQQLDRADLIVLVFDRSQSWTRDQQTLADPFPGALAVHNKLDLCSVAALSEFQPSRPKGIDVSALTGERLPDLISAITSRLVPQPPAHGEAVPFTADQVAALQQAHQQLQAGMLDDARHTLSAIL